jgi:hypothetical protein
MMRASAIGRCTTRVLSGLYRMIALDGLEVDEAADRQPVLVVLALVNHSVDMLGQNFPSL